VIPQDRYENAPSLGSPASGGKTIWDMATNLPNEKFSYGSRWSSYETGGNPEGCSNNNSDNAQYDFIPAVPVDTALAKSLVPPFCASTTPIRCGH
jgi:hypothetical protein